MISCLLLIKHLTRPSHFLTDLWNRLCKNLPFNIKCDLTLMFITGDRKTNGESASCSLSGCNSVSSFASGRRNPNVWHKSKQPGTGAKTDVKGNLFSLIHTHRHPHTHTHKPTLWKRLIKPSETCQQLDIPLVKLLCESTTRAFISASTERQTGWQIFHFSSYYSLTSSSSRIN